MVGSKSFNDVYAKWKTKPVKFELNGGKFLEEPRQYQYLSFYENNIDPVKENYIFEGWYLDPNFEEPLPSNINEPITEEVTLYAKWAPLIKVALSIDSDYKVINLVGKAGDTIRYPGASHIVKKGKVFKGWYADSGLTKSAPEVFPNQHSTVYAKYDDAYVLTFQGLEGKYNYYKYYNVPLTLTAMIFTKFTENSQGPYWINSIKTKTKPYSPAGILTKSIPKNSHKRPPQTLLYTLNSLSP
ncbi:MAG TPA: InlB B-repeat-containing protein [Clostridia bacterium]